MVSEYGEVWYGRVGTRLSKNCASSYCILISLYAILMFQIPSFSFFLFLFNITIIIISSSVNIIFKADFYCKRHNNF